MTKLAHVRYAAFACLACLVEAEKYRFEFATRSMK